MIGHYTRETDSEAGVGKMTQKTNAARLLDQRGIHYALREYDVDPEDLAAETVAAKIGLPPEQVFKTLVARGDRKGIDMAVIPGDQELNLKVSPVVKNFRRSPTNPSSHPIAVSIRLIKLSTNTRGNPCPLPRAPIRCRS